MWRCTEGNGYLGLKENAEKTLKTILNIKLSIEHFGSHRKK